VTACLVCEPAVRACSTCLQVFSISDQYLELKVACVRLPDVSDPRTVQSIRVPEHVRAFLHSVSDSYEKLYTLLALFSQSAGATLVSLCERLGLDDGTVVVALEALRRAGVVKPDSQRMFVYVSDRGPRHASVEWLAEHHDLASVEIAKLLNDIALARVRAALHGRLSIVTRRNVDQRTPNPSRRNDTD